MSAPRKYDQEFRERAVRLYRDRLEQHDESKLAARRQVGVLLDIEPGDTAELGGGRGACRRVARRRFEGGRV